MKLVTLLAAIFFLVLFAAPAAYADWYIWTDEEGVLHVADDMLKVPEEYRGKVNVIKKEKAEEKRGTAPSARPSRTTPSKPARPTSIEELYGGHPLRWWADQFEKLNDRIEKAEESISEKRRYVEVFDKGRRFGQIFDEEEISSYERYKLAIPREEVRLEDLNEEFEELERKARYEGVPKKIRGE